MSAAVIPTPQQRRLKAITSQLVDAKSAAPQHKTATAAVAAVPTSAKKAAGGKPGVKADDDIVIVASVRTAIGRAKKGGLKDTFIDDMLAATLTGLMAKTNGKVKPADVGDLVVGCVLGQNGQRANEARIAMFQAGFPDTVPVHTLNRQCSSGLQAIAEVAACIRSGFYEIGIGAGMESMSLGRPGWDGAVNPRIFMNKQAQACLLPMGITSENVSKKYKITRAEQDAFAVTSHARAAAAQKAGKFVAEIIPVKTRVKDEKTGATKDIVFAADDGIRADTTLEGLAKLPPAFDKAGSTTAGTSSQVSDGAAASLLMTRAKARSLGLPVLGVFRGFAVAGVPPEVMGIGPAFAIPAVLKQTGLSTGDIGRFELNEAFASQALMSCKTLKLDMDKVNVNGGAIALGHPLGCTGARLTASLLHEMQRSKQQFGIVSMCIGSGMGAAGVFECEFDA